MNTHRFSQPYKTYRVRIYDVDRLEALASAAGEAPETYLTQAWEEWRREHRPGTARKD